MAESNIKLRVDARQAEQSLRRINSLVGKLGLALGAVDIGRRVFKGFTEANNAAAAVSTLGVNADKLKKQLLSLSAEQKGLTSQTELLAASYDVASAGFNSASEATNVLRAASLGAVGGLSDLNTVANATTSVLNAYGLESSKAQKLVDGFIQTQNDGKIIVAQYASQIGRVAPTAAAAGVGIDELNAAISAVTATGVPVESTFAGIRQVIASVIKPSKEASDRAAELGIEFSTAAIRTKGFGGFLEDLIKKTGGSEVELSKLFGSVEALTALMPLINDDLEKFNNSLENQKNAFGVAKKAADTMGETVSGQLKALVNNAGNLARTLDEGLGPAIQDTLKPLNSFLAQSVQLFTKIPPEVVKFTAKAAALTAVGVTLRKVMLLTFLAKLPRILTVVNGLHQVWFRKIVLLRLATLKARAAFLALKAAMPFGFVLVAAGLLTEKILELQQAQQDYNDLVKEGGRAAVEAAINELNARQKVLEAKREELEGKGGQSARGQRKGIDRELEAIGQKQTDLLNRLFQISTNEAGQAFAQPPANTIQPTNGALTNADKISDEQKLAELSRQKVQALEDQAALASAVNEEEERRVKLNIDLRKIAENAQGFADADVEAQMNARIELEEKRDAAIAYNKELENAAKIEEQARKDRQKAEEEARKARENDPLVRMQEELDKLVSKETQALAAATSIGNAFTDAFADVITGTKSVSEAGSDMLKSIAADFLAMAKKIIAQQLIMILYQSILKALGGPGGNFEMNPLGGLSFSEAVPFADGGYVSGPTNALIGEGGEPEYVIPESKMRESMARFSRGARGSSVIPEAGGSGTSGEGGGIAVAAPIDVRYTVERINSVDYVTADQFQAGMQQAATQGAKQGEQQTLKRLQMSGSTRKRIGI